MFIRTETGVKPKFLFFQVLLIFIIPKTTGNYCYFVMSSYDLFIIISLSLCHFSTFFLGFPIF